MNTGSEPEKESSSYESPKREETEVSSVSLPYGFEVRTTGAVTEAETPPVAPAVAFPVAVEFTIAPAEPFARVTPFTVKPV